MLIGFIIAYLVVSRGIGLYAATKIHSAVDYITAARSLPMIVVVATVFATWFGTEAGLVLRYHNDKPLIAPVTAFVPDARRHRSHEPAHGQPFAFRNHGVSHFQIGEVGKANRRQCVKRQRGVVAA